MLAPLNRLIARIHRFAYKVIARECIRWLPARRSKKANVLILRLDGLGDFIIWLSTGASEAAKWAKGQGHSVLLAKSDWAEFARSLNIFDEVWALDVPRFEQDAAYRIRWMLKIRRVGFRAILQPRSARDFWLEDSLVRAGRAPISLGNLGDERNISAHLKKISDRWYTSLIETSSGTISELEKSLSFHTKLHGETPSVLNVKFDDAILHRLELETPYIVLAPGAGWSGRRWPTARYAELAVRVLRCHDMRWVIVGDSTDHAAGAAIYRQMDSGSCLNLCGQLNLSEIGAILERATLVIANESGIAHFATFVGTDVIVITGGGHFGMFMPYPVNALQGQQQVVYQAMECFGCNWKCKYPIAPGHPAPCIDNVSLDKITDAVSEKLRGLSAREAEHYCSQFSPR